MPNSGNRKNGNVRLTRLRVKNQNENVAAQESSKTTKNLEWIANDGAFEKTKISYQADVISKSKKLYLESSPEQLEILSVKKDKDQVMIEFRASSITSAPSISGTDDGFTEIKVEDEIEFGATSISVQLTDAEIHNYQTVDSGPKAIKVENEVDIKIEDEMEFCALSPSAQSIPETDDEDQSNQTIQDEFAEVDDEMEFSDEVGINALNTPETTVNEKLGEPEKKKNESVFTCDICSKEFSKEKYLITHQLRHGRPNYHCSVCGVGKFSQKEVDCHIRIHDANLFIFTCDICPKKFANEAYLIRHQQRHGKPNYHCKVCGVSKFSSPELTSHMRIHDTNPHFTCDSCSKKFSNEAVLIRHQLRHGKPNYHCKVCGVSKFRSYELTNHMRIHDTNPPITCDICSKKFLTKICLNAHRLRHGKPNFHCTVCGVVKFTKFELSRHMKVHLNRPERTNKMSTD